MSLSILVDINLTPDWVPALRQQGFQCVHWSTVGLPIATDQTIMAWAQAQGHVVFTHDLDFGTMLALTHATGPSVLQVRADKVKPSNLLGIVLAALQQHVADLTDGAIVVVDPVRSRVRILPI